MKLHEALSIDLMTDKSDNYHINEGVADKLKGLFKHSSTKHGVGAFAAGSVAGAATYAGVVGAAAKSGFGIAGAASTGIVGSAAAMVSNIIAGTSMIQLVGGAAVMGLLGYAAAAGAVGYTAYRVYEYSTSSRKYGKELGDVIKKRDELIVMYTSLTDKTTAEASRLLKKIDAASKSQTQIARKLMSAIDRDYKDGRIDDAGRQELNSMLKIAVDARLTQLNSSQMRESLASDNHAALILESFV